MSKILVIPDNMEDIDKYNDKDIKGLIFGFKDLSVNNNLYLDIDSLKDIIKDINSKFEIWISLNKIMHNKDLELLENTLIELDKLKITGILFYDLGVLNICKRLNLNIKLSIYQDHLNASINSNNFYYNKGVEYSLVTNDITIDEVLDINNKSNIKMMVNVYGYLPIFYSRRYLVSNYMEYINKDKLDYIYYLKDKDDYYPIVEEDYGTTVYTKYPINLIKYIDKLNSIEYIILNSNYIDKNEFMSVLDKYINKDIDDNDNYEGFSNTKTIYTVKNYE